MKRSSLACGTLLGLCFSCGSAPQEPRPEVVTMPAPSAQPVTSISPPNIAGDGGERTKAGQCNVVIEAVNAGQHLFKVDVEASQMALQAENLDAFAKSLGELTITDRELKTSIEEYRRIVNDTASVLRDVAKGDPNIDKRVEEIAERESVVVNRVNAYCSRN